MSQQMPKFLMGGINIYKSFTGTGVVKAFGYTAAEMTLKTSPVFLMIGYSYQTQQLRPAMQDVIPPAPVRRTSLTE